MARPINGYSHHQFITRSPFSWFVRLARRLLQLRGHCPATYRQFCADGCAVRFRRRYPPALFGGRVSCRRLAAT